MEHILDNDELRNIIEGKTKFKPCVKCSGRGYNWVDWDGELFLTKPTKTISDDYDYVEETCDSCEGLKYQEL